MPRVSGIYSRPTGIDAVANNTIDSGKYNSNVADVEADLNLPRPVIAGGTGATNAHDARDNLDAEIASQTVTNYDTHVFESGSFWSQTSATGGPAPGQVVTGFSVTLPNNDQNWITLLAMDHSTGNTFIRIKTNGTWGAWSQRSGSVVEADARYVNVTGDSMTGDLTIVKGSPALILNKASASQAVIRGQNAGFTRWEINLAREGFADSFSISRYNDSGTWVNDPLTIDRATGNASFTGNLSTGQLISTFNSFVPSNADGASIRASGSYGGAFTLIDGAARGSVWMQGGSMRIGANPSGLNVGGSGGVVGTISKFRVERMGADVSLPVGGATAASIVWQSNAGEHGLSFRPGSNEATFYPILFQNFSDAGIGLIQCTSTTTTYTTSSDGTLKEDLQPAGVTAGQIINDTEIYDFKWKGTDERAYGVIAQQASPIYSKAFVHDEERDRWFVDYSKYVPILIQEAKTLKTRIADLETKLTGAMSRLDVLDKFREKIEAL